MKRLTPDPWKSVEDRYKVGQRVKGKIRKINSFGLFVELDPEIHGLAHVSELGMKPEDVQKVKVGDELEFTIVSLKPAEYRLGLSLVKGDKPSTVNHDVPSSDQKSESAPADPSATPEA